MRAAIAAGLSSRSVPTPTLLFAPEPPSLDTGGNSSCCAPSVTGGGGATCETDAGASRSVSYATRFQCSLSCLASTRFAAAAYSASATRAAASTRLGSVPTCPRRWFETCALLNSPAGWTCSSAIASPASSGAGLDVSRPKVDAPPNCTTLTVDRPAMSWQKTASSPGAMRPRLAALVSASTSVRDAPGWCTTEHVSSAAFKSTGAESAGTTPRYTSWCLASASPSTVHFTVPPRTVGMLSDSTGHAGWYFATKRVVSPVCENTTIRVASIWNAVCTAAAESASLRVSSESRRDVAAWSASLELMNCIWRLYRDS
mmetsp:Transcript_667/g.2706  ORF Transcript_667/g.2706 Transcript_667/m.2706 type:complete len:315 (-) Transcript_667:1373-2317(-)